MTGIVLMAYVLGIGFCIVAWGITRHKHPARQAGSAPLPVRGVDPKRPCDSTGCGYPAGVWVIVADNHGGGVRFVCHGCADEGTAFGWWRARLPKDATALDFEVVDDLPRIERFANGEAS